MNQRGVAMALTLGVVIVFTTLGAAFLVRSLNESLIGSRSVDRHEAFYLAEAGLDQASINLRTPTDATDDILTQTLSTGTFQLESTTELQPQVWQVISRGTSQGEVRRVEAVYQLTPQSVFQFGLFGNQSVRVGGHAQTDSYDSRLGAYNPNPGPGFNKSQNGDVGTNSITAGGITMVGGGLFIEGQVAVGSGVAIPESIVTGYNPLLITGDPHVVSQPNPFPIPSVTVPAPLLPFCVNQQYQGQTVTTLSSTGGPLGNGTYCYCDLEVRGGAQLIADGPVKVYLTGELRLGGNSSSGSDPGIGLASDPTKMTFLMTSPAGTIDGSGTFYGALYAPNATMTVSGNAKVFGSIVALSVDASGNAQVHYDKALGNTTTVSNQYQRTVVSWRDLN